MIKRLSLLLPVAALLLAGCAGGVTSISITTESMAYMFVGSSSEAREDWIRPLDKDTLIFNRMGMNNADYGGGIPCAVVWTPEECIAIGSLSPVPLDIALPIERKDDRITISIDPLDEKMPKLFIYKGKGDCFLALREYGKALAKAGVKPADPEEWANETEWCAWGYGRTFTKKEVLETLPKVQEMGMKWVTLDDGYQICEGDWDLDPAVYPGGDAEMKAFVDSIHARGFKAMIWWAPLAADPGSQFLKDHPDAIQTDEVGTPYDISWWDSWMLSPSDPDVIAETRRLVRKFIGEYGFDGFKLDGQHLNCVHPDYNPAHHPEDPYYDFHHLPEFYKLIYDEARAIKPHAVIQLCPCGDVQSVYNFQYINQTVASDPLSSYQVRTKGYVIKALAPQMAYYGDHVELTSTGMDFPSQLAVGALPGTKFTWPTYNPDEGPGSMLTPEKEALWKKMFNLYESEKQSEGELLGGLYDIAFDYPETYVIRKADGAMYYSLFADEYNGKFDFRGLGEGEYEVEDLWTGKNLGTVSNGDSALDIVFGEFKLLKLTKI